MTKIFVIFWYSILNDSHTVIKHFSSELMMMICYNDNAPAPTDSHTNEISNTFTGFCCCPVYTVVAAHLLFYMWPQNSFFFLSDSTFLPHMCWVNCIDNKDKYCDFKSSVYECVKSAGLIFTLLDVVMISLRSVLLMWRRQLLLK